MYRLVTLPSDTIDAAVTFVSIAIFFVLAVIVGEFIFPQNRRKKPMRQKEKP